MKSLFKKFAPGVALAVLTVAVSAAFVLRAQTTPAPSQILPPKPAAVDRVEPPAYQPTSADVGRAIFAPPHQAAPVSAVSPVTICGVCGARIEAPQPVYVAQPVAGQGYGSARAARDFIGGGNLAPDGRFTRTAYGEPEAQPAPQTVIVYVIDPNRPLPVPELPLLPVGIVPPPIPAAHHRHVFLAR